MLSVFSVNSVHDSPSCKQKHTIEQVKESEWVSEWVRETLARERESEQRVRSIARQGVTTFVLTDW